MLYCTAYGKIKAVFKSHSASFDYTFDDCLGLVGGFGAIEEINVTGGEQVLW
jgi:hypothetical protein